MDLPKNTFKARMAKGETQIGLWCSLCSPIAAEVVCYSGFDWLLLDTEHSPNDLQEIYAQLQASAPGTAHSVVRPAWNDPVLIKRYLDIGAQTILLPYVQNADEAAAAVAATRYPPLGIRGVTGSGRAARYGRVKDYLKKANDEICVLVQVETREALAQLDKIATVPGVDGVFVGPSDLSASFGHIGNPAHPEVQAAIEDAGRRIRKAGKGAGILTVDETEARRYIGWGYNFAAVGVDIVTLAKATDALAQKFKS